jgi:hypothetical protein
VVEVDVSLVPQQLPDALADDRLVIDQQYCDGLASRVHRMQWMWVWQDEAGGGIG